PHDAGAGRGPGRGESQEHPKTITEPLSPALSPLVPPAFSPSFGRGKRRERGRCAPVCDWDFRTNCPKQVRTARARTVRASVRPECGLSQILRFTRRVATDNRALDAN